MNLIIEMTDNIGMDYYYVTMYCEGEMLLIETPDRRMKDLTRRLPIRELQKVHWQVKGRIRRLFFTYGREDYSIVDVGDEFAAIAEKLLLQTLV